MLVLLAYDTPEQKDQNFLRREFMRVGGERVQYSIYLFEGEPHECERVVRYMQRVTKGIPGDIRLLQMEKSVWDAQFILSLRTEAQPPSEDRRFPEFIEIW
jgi:CRISPR-associated endonuclease Cas2